LELAQAVAGVVRWIRPPSDAHDASPGMGVQLIDPPSDVTAAIAAYAATREPVFYD